MDAQHALSEIQAGFKTANASPGNEEKQMAVEQAAALSAGKIGVILKMTSKTSSTVQLLMAILYDTTACVAAEEVIRSFNAGVSNKQYGNTWRLVSIGKPVSEIGSCENLRTLLETDWISWFITPVGQPEQAWHESPIPFDIANLPAVESIPLPIPDVVPPSKNRTSPFGEVRSVSSVRLFFRKWFWWIPVVGWKI